MRNLLATALVALLCHYSAAFADERVVLETRSGVTQSFLYEDAVDPPASLLLFEGGPGALNANLRNLGFLEKSRQAFAKRGFAVAIIEPPSDRHGDLTRNNFRQSSNHRRDVEAVIRYLRGKHNKPIWLIGISLGTLSVAEIASRTEEPIGGIVLLSSKTRDDRGSGILDSSLQRIKASALVISHAKDACSSTPPSDSTKIVAALKNSRRTEFTMVEGGFAVPSSSPCLPGTFHTFLGTESKVVDSVSTFILSDPMASNGR